jgi:type IV pilus assembly protein PilM
LSPSRKSAPSAVVGLDIGTDSIKVAEAKFAKDGITITGLGIARTPPGAIENEVIVDSKALGDAVKALLGESGIKTKRCVSSVSGASQVVVRVISVPKMKREELAETMKWEVERHVPFSPNEVVMDFQPLDLPGADPDATEM